MAARRAVFFFDLGRLHGLGHFRRCEALAAELAARGWKCSGAYRSADPAEALPSRLAADRRFPLERWRGPVAAADLAVVDSYLADAAERAALRAASPRMLSFLDAPAADPADVVVDFNCGAEPAAYARAGCAGRVLAGPDYFPVRAELLERAAASRGRDRSGPARRLLVAFGGTGLGPTEKTMAELAAGVDLEIRVVAGDLAAGNPDLRGATAVPPGSNLGKWYAWADLALAAGGIAKYELALFGVPAIITAIVENQSAVAEAFAAAGAARYLGTAADLAPGALSRAVLELAADAAARAAMSSAGKRMVDGRGAARIADGIEALAEDGR